MSVPNRNILWARVFVDELVKQGIKAICVAPGSRSTPLVTALSERTEVQLFSHPDERSAAFFALGHAKARRRPVPLVSTSGTAAVNFHPAVVEASHSNVPMLLLTADRPPVLQDSGANQTIDQVRLYGSSVRWFHQVPEPEPDDRKFRALRRLAARAIARSTGDPAGPVHLNFPFRKPLAPDETKDEPLERYVALNGQGIPGETDRPIRVSRARPSADPEEVERWAGRLENVDRCLLVAGPETGNTEDRRMLATFSAEHAVPVAADPLSGLRFGDAVDTASVLGGYDSYAPDLFTGGTPAPDLVFRVGSNSTSTALTRTLARTGVDQVLVNPDGSWTDDTFSADDLIESTPASFFKRLSDELGTVTFDREWTERLLRTDRTCFDAIDRYGDSNDFEGGYIMEVLDRVSNPVDLFVSNSMPVRDLDRFGRPSEKDIRVYGNRGASGIDGIISSALGVRSASGRDLVLVMGDLAFYHDMNGLIALRRFDLNATIVVINNNGGGIFHMLPIEDHDPPFTDYFKTPHDLDFSHAGRMYGLTYHRVESRKKFRKTFDESLDSDGSDLLEVEVDAEKSHRYREEIEEHVRRVVGDLEKSS